MTSPKQRISMEEAVQYLVNYSTDRSDLMACMEYLSEDVKIDRADIETEMQLLKIVSVGWSISYLSGESPIQKALNACFWNFVRDLSGSISTMIKESMDKDVDYFTTLKERFETYVNGLNQFPDIKDPGPIVGQVFAGLCGDVSDAYLLIAGKRMFHDCLAEVKDYLVSVEIENVEIESS